MADHRARDEAFKAAVIVTTVLLLCIAGWWAYRWWTKPRVAYFYMRSYP